jgi:hypothetical protein
MREFRMPRDDIRQRPQQDRDEHAGEQKKENVDAVPEKEGEKDKGEEDRGCDGGTAGEAVGGGWFCCVRLTVSLRHGERQSRTTCVEDATRKTVLTPSSRYSGERDWGERRAGFHVVRRSTRWIVRCDKSNEMRLHAHLAPLPYPLPGVPGRGRKMRAAINP